MNIDNFTFHIIFLLFFINYGCAQDRDLKNKHQEDDAITIIFHPRNTDYDVFTYESGATSESSLPIMSYCLNNSFLTNVIFPNPKKIDTITINNIKDSIYLTHRYYYAFSTNYILKKGDTVEIQYPSQYPIVKIYNRKVNNDELNFLTQYNVEHFYPLIPKKLNFKLTEEEKSEYKNQRKKEISNLLVQLDSLLNNKLISKEYYNFISGQYQKIDFKNLDFYIIDNNLSIPYYRNLLSQYHNYKTQDIKPLKYSNGSIINFKEKFDRVLIIDSILPKNKDFLLFTLMEGIATDFSKNDFDTYFEKFKRNVSDKSLIKYLENKYLTDYEQLRVETANTNLFSPQKEKSTLKQIFNSNKGKVIYIDFWASWCAPCMEAMPASHQLHEKYKDKDVVFLYLSMDKDFEAWQKANTRLNLGEENSYLILNAENSDFMKQLNISTIPRYLIYDKTGKLVYQNAPGPGAENIEEVLDGYLR